MVRLRLEEFFSRLTDYDVQYINGEEQKAEIFFFAIDRVKVSVKSDDKISYLAQCRLISFSTMKVDLIGRSTLIIRAAEELTNEDERENIKATDKTEQVVRTKSGIETSLSFDYYLEVEHDKTDELIKQIKWEVQ